MTRPWSRDNTDSSYSTYFFGINEGEWIFGSCRYVGGWLCGSFVISLRFMPTSSPSFNWITSSPLLSILPCCHQSVECTRNSIGGPLGTITVCHSPICGQSLSVLEHCCWFGLVRTGKGWPKSSTSVVKSCKALLPEKKAWVPPHCNAMLATTHSNKILAWGEAYSINQAHDTRHVSHLSEGNK